MKYLDNYKIFESESEDLSFIMAKIKGEFPEEKVTERLDEEILEWVDSDWEDDYDSEYDWYQDHNNGEAEDVVIDEIIDWYEDNWGKLSDNIRSEVIDSIKEEYYLN